MVRLLPFMHSVQEGAASKSYGLAVAALAGAKRGDPPCKAEIKRAGNPIWSFRASHAETPQLMLLADIEPSEVELALNKIDPDSLTPKQALELLYHLKRAKQITRKAD